VFTARLINTYHVAKTILFLTSDDSDFLFAPCSKLMTILVTIGEIIGIDCKASEFGRAASFLERDNLQKCRHTEALNAHSKRAVASNTLLT